MNVIVDLQGFKTEYNEFILKEIAVLTGTQLIHLLFEPPFSFHELTEKEKKQVCWIQRNRKIFWKEGYVSYGDHKNIIRNILRNKNIYVKGLEKIQWLTNIMDDCNVGELCNLEDFGCPSLLSLYEKYKDCVDVYQCIHHFNICALKNVKCIQKWNCENKCF